jgi:hypothetical protein
MRGSFVPGRRDTTSGNTAILRYCPALWGGKGFVPLDLGAEGDFDIRDIAAGDFVSRLTKIALQANRQPMLASSLRSSLVSPPGP